MRTIRITLVGGPFCGECYTDCPGGATYLFIGGLKYLRSDRRDAENQQVFILEHTRTLGGLQPCNPD